MLFRKFKTDFWLIVKLGQYKQLFMRNERMNSFDSRNTEPQPNKVPISPRKGRKISIENIESENQNIFGIFSLDDYTVMRGFVPGKGKNIRLHYTKIQPPKKIANVCIIPSYAGKSDDYLDIADALAKQNMVVHILNIRGLASYSGTRLNGELEEMFSDIECLLRCCETKIPIFLCSFGFGSTLLTSLLVDNPHLPINGVILVSPTLFVPEPQMSLKRLTLKYICRQLFGDLLVHLPLNLSSLTKNIHHFKKMIDDGAQIQYITLNVLKTLQQASEYMINNGNKINYPVVLCYGLMNSFSSADKMKTYFQSIGSVDKTIIQFQKGYHFLHNDEENKTLKQSLISWIHDRVPSKNLERVLKIPPLVILSKFPKFWTWKKLLCLLSFMFFVYRLLVKRILRR